MPGNQVSDEAFHDNCTGQNVSEKLPQFHHLVKLKRDNQLKASNLVEKPKQNYFLKNGGRPKMAN